MTRSTLLLAVGLIAAGLAPNGARVHAAGQAAAQADEALAAARRDFEAGRYREAVAVLEAAEARDRKEPRLYYWLARAQYELHQFKSARKAAERAAALNPNQSDYQLWLARATGQVADRYRGLFGLSALSLAGKAREAFERAVELDGSNIEARRDLMAFYLEAPGIVGGGADKALRQVEAIAKLDAVEGHVARAEYWRHKDHLEQADAEYRLALEAQPRTLGPYMDAADFYTERGDAARLQAVVEAARRVDGSDPRLVFYGAVARVLAGTGPDEAERSLTSYFQDVPERSDRPSPASAHEWLGRLYEKEGRREEAVAQYRAALERDANRKVAKEALRRLGERP